MLKNSNPFWGVPCTDAINSINYNTPHPHSTGALPLEAWHLLTLFAGEEALSAITDIWTKQGCPLKKGSVPVCIFPSQTKRAGRYSAEARWCYFAKSKDAVSNITLALQRVLPMTCSILHFLGVSGCATLRSPYSQCHASPTTHHLASAYKPLLASMPWIAYSSLKSKAGQL